jgi:hypothetical protein
VRPPPTLLGVARLASGGGAATLDKYFGGGCGHPRSKSVVGHPWVFFFFFFFFFVFCFVFLVI